MWDDRLKQGGPAIEMHMALSYDNRNIPKWIILV